MTKPEKMAVSTENLKDEQIKKIENLFPEAIKGGKVDFDELRNTLGDLVEDPAPYSLYWRGKADCFATIQAPSTGTLKPDRNENESVDFDNTGNIIVEGDNLEVLKLLQKSYHGKIKMIYIDPPYNTGNDFVYKDDFRNGIEQYKKAIGAKSESGEVYKANPKLNGRFHTDWLNMMYPRLFLARNLLKDDGVIFVSIDDNEIHNLRLIMNEIFGEENFISQIVVEGTPKSDPYLVSTAHEYCLVFTKNYEVAKKSNYGLVNPVYDDLDKIFNQNKPDFQKVKKELKAFFEKNQLENENISNYCLADKDGVYRIGPIDDPQGGGSKNQRINPQTGKPCKIPSGGWRCNDKTWDDWKKQNLILFPESDDLLPAKKTYISKERLDVMRAYFKIQTRKDTDNLKKLFDTETTVFPNPKPLELIKTFISNTNDRTGIFLDFFAGSATTAHAVLDLNKFDDGKRTFICVQLPEILDEKNAKTNKDKKIIRAGLDFCKRNKLTPNIAELAKERVRRVIKKFTAEKKQSKITNNSKPDLGFKVFKLDRSNFKVWTGEKETVQKGLEDYENRLVPKADEEAILYEILLKNFDIELGSKIEIIMVAGKKVYSLNDNAFLVCLEKKLSSELFKEIKKKQPLRLFVLDESFDGDDELKANALQILGKSASDGKSVLMVG